MSDLQLIVPPRPAPPPVKIDELQHALDAATDPAEIKEIEDKLGAIEQYMKNTGLYTFDEMFPVNVAKVKARWKLGRALAAVERGRGERTDLTSGEGRPKSNFKAFVQRLDLNPTTAKEAQRIGAMPDEEREKVCALAQKERRFVHYASW
jgi:hypothetical protein